MFFPAELTDQNRISTSNDEIHPQKCRLKIITVVYGGSCWSACRSRASTAKSVSPTSEIRTPTESQQDFLHFYVYIVYVK